ncbi:MAG: DUF1573 domain-containing protein [Flavobacteriaceae bacterium]|nr:DUF1573 domain-containing protein [Flavobacteriaceae bacterium]
MKKIVLTFIVLVSVLSLNAQEIKSDVIVDSNAPVFQFETDIMDYGKITQNANGVRKFKFKNIGKSDLLITSVSSSCGCTVPNYSKEPIKPGGTGEIEIAYNTAILGGFSKMITVFSNASEPQKILRLKGIVSKVDDEVVLEKKSSLVSQK